MALVTVGGEMGAGRAGLGREVANLLGVEYRDRRAIAQEAQRLTGTAAEVIEERFEVAPPRGKIGGAIQKFLERSAAAGAAGDPFLGPTGVEELLSRTLADAARAPASAAEELDDKTYIEILREVILVVAESNNAVIIGGGSQLILADRPAVLRVYVIAPHEARVSRIMGSDGRSREDAERFIQETDDARVAWIKKFFKADVGDPQLYDLVLNTGRLSIATGAQAVAELARLRAVLG